MQPSCLPCSFSRVLTLGLSVAAFESGINEMGGELNLQFWNGVKRASCFDCEVKTSQSRLSSVENKA